MMVLFSDGVFRGQAIALMMTEVIQFERLCHVVGIHGQFAGALSSCSSVVVDEASYSAIRAFSSPSSLMMPSDPKYLNTISTFT